MSEQMQTAGAEKLWVRLADGRRFGPGEIGMIAQWAREGRVPPDAVIEKEDGSGGVPAGEHPELVAIMQAPPMVAGPMPVQDSGISVIIPYRNGRALASYYMGLFSVLPVAIVFGIGMTVLSGVMGHDWMRGATASRTAAKAVGGVLIVLLTAVIGFSAPVSAIVMGCKGIGAANRDPKVRGKVHAWVGIVAGSFGALVGIGFLIGMIVLASGR